MISILRNKRIALGNKKKALELYCIIFYSMFSTASLRNNTNRILMRFPLLIRNRHWCQLGEKSYHMYEKFKMFYIEMFNGWCSLIQKKLFITSYFHFITNSLIARYQFRYSDRVTQLEEEIRHIKHLSAQQRMFTDEEILQAELADNKLL